MFTPLFKRLRSLVTRPELSFKERAKLCKNKNILSSINNYPMSSLSEEEMSNYIYDLVKTIIDPEKPYTLEELNIVNENGIKVQKNVNTSIFFISVEFTPTISHCSLATLIGLCIRIKLKANILAKHKLIIRVKEGTHVTEDAVNKQINDKERVAAAMENPSLSKLVFKCIEEET